MQHRRPPTADTVRLSRGQVVHVGQAVWNTQLYLELDQAVDIFSAHGARVVLFTMPDINAADEAPDSAAYPERLCCIECELVWNPWSSCPGYC